MNSLSVREFSSSIINFVYKSPLPMEVKRLVLQDIYGQVNNEATEELRREIIERADAEKEAAGEAARPENKGQEKEE